MDISTWALTLIANLLGKTSIPKFLVSLIISQLGKILTPANVAKVENDVECMIVGYLRKVAAAKKCPDLDKAVDFVQAQLGCVCTPTAAPAAAAAQGL